MKLQPQGSFTETESLGCQEWLLISTVLWEVVANLWLGRTWQVSSCSSSLPWPMSTCQIPPTFPLCSSLLWDRVELSPWELPFISVLAFLPKVCAQAIRPGWAVHPQGQASCPQVSQLPCTHGSPFPGSSGSTAKPAVTGYWAPTNVNVMFTAHTEVPHGLQAVCSWLRARRETTPAAWWAETSSPAADQAGKSTFAFCL